MNLRNGRNVFSLTMILASLFFAGYALADGGQTPTTRPAEFGLIQTIRGNAPGLKPEQIKPDKYETGRCETMEGPYLVRAYSKWVYVLDPARHDKGTGGTQLHQFEKAADGTVTYKRDLAIPKELEGLGYNSCPNLLFKPLAAGKCIAYFNNFGWGGNSDLWRFSVDPDTGEMAVIGKTHTAAGPMVMSPDKKFIYISGNKTVQGFSLDDTTGEPAPLAAGLKTYGFNIAIADDGKYVYTVEHESSDEGVKKGNDLQTALVSKRQALKQAGRDSKTQPDDAGLKRKIADLNADIKALEKEWAACDKWYVCTCERDAATGAIGPAKGRVVMAETQDVGLCNRLDFLHVFLAPQGNRVIVAWQDSGYKPHWSAYARNAADGTVRFDCTKADAVWFKMDLVVSPGKTSGYYATYWEGGGVVGSFDWDDKEIYTNHQKLMEGVFQSVDLDPATRTLYAVDMRESKLKVFRLGLGAGK